MSRGLFISPSFYLVRAYPSHIVTSRFTVTALLVIIKFVNSRNKIQLPVQPEEPLVSEPSTSDSTPRSTEPARPGSSNRSIGFDYNLARISLLIEVISYAGAALSPNGLFYTIATVVGAFGSGFGPAAQSVALSLYNQSGGTESGKLFGALSVVQSLSYVFLLYMIFLGIKGRCL